MTVKDPTPIVVPPAEAPLQPVKRSRGARMAVLIGPAQEAPRFVTRRFQLEPGGRIPCHRHPDIEHEQVMVRGEMVLGFTGGEWTVRAGDAVFIPVRAAHWYENRGVEPAEFLCIIPRTADYGTEWLEDPPPGAAE
jgi:quercetin dioxygenase-like cupin family protein